MTGWGGAAAVLDAPLNMLVMNKDLVTLLENSAAWEWWICLHDSFTGGWPVIQISTVGSTGIHSEKCIVRQFGCLANVYVHKPR